MRDSPLEHASPNIAWSDRDQTNTIGTNTIFLGAAIGRHFFPTLLAFSAIKVLRRLSEDEIQAFTRLLHRARDARLVRVHGAVINRQAGSAFEVQSRFPIGNSGDYSAGNILVRVVDRAAQSAVLRS